MTRSPRQPARHPTRDFARAVALAAAWCALGSPSGGTLAAQGLPAYAPINPLAASRTGLYFQPYRAPARGWQVAAALDYGSAAELNGTGAPAAYVLDSELLRASVAVSRDVGHSAFVLAELQLGGAYAGFLDGFLGWYHRLFGIRFRERDALPPNEFRYAVGLADGSGAERAPSAAFLGDVRLGLGRRHSGALQTVLAVTLPTATAPAGYGRGAVSLAVLNTARVALGRRLVYEGSVGVGFTPAHGALAAWQRELFASASSGLRYRVWGRHSLYANLFYHSPYYHGTALDALDRRELSLDFGWILARDRGAEWRLGMTEDLEPSGPGIDLVFRLGVGFPAR